MHRPDLTALRCALLLGCVVLSAQAQQEATLNARSTLVFVPVRVQTEDGGALTGLTAENFVLTDNGVRQKIRLEPVEGQRLAILVVMQTGGAAPRQFDFYRGVPAMLGSLAGTSDHRSAVMTFDSAPEDMFDFTADDASLAEAFTKPVGGDSGAAVLDAVNEGIDLLRQQPSDRRRIMILLSQPYDQGSKAQPQQVIRRLGENNVTIFSITFSPEQTWLKDQFTKPQHGNALYKFAPDLPAAVGTFSLSEPLGMALKAMRTDAAAEVAELSGGEHVRFADRRSLDEDLNAIANHLPNRYLLSFQPGVATQGYHRLSVTVVGPTQPATVSAREGYWVSDPAPGGRVH